MASPNRKENPMKSIAMPETPQNLPQDLITDILLRLPVKSIGQFKCVSKPWRSLLSSPSFVKAHLKLHIYDPEDLIFTSPISDQALYILALTAQSHIYDGIARKVNFPIKYKKAWIEVVASGNGLVLHLIRFECRVVLMNPITLEAVELPHRPYVPDTMYCAYGMGFVSSKNDYTIVSISKERVGDTYSLKMKTWRRLADLPHKLANLSPAAFVNGRIHYLALSDSRTINSGWLLAAFNLANEEFEEVPLPSGVELDGKSKAEIRALDGCLVWCVNRTVALTFG